MNLVPKVLHRRRALRAGFVALLAVSGSLVWSSAANADKAKIPLVKDQTAWFWSSNREVRQCITVTEDRGVCQVVDGTSAAPVEPGHLAVALNLGSSDMRSYIFIDLSNIPSGSKVDKLILTLPVSRADPGNTAHTQRHTGQNKKAPSTTNEQLAKVRACAVTAPWGESDGAPSFGMDPKDPTKTTPVEPFVRDETDCTKFKTQGKAGTAWNFDLTSIAQQWVDGTLENNGIVLLPDVTGERDSWRLEFHAASFSLQQDETVQEFVAPSEAGFAQATFTPPPSEPPPVIVDPPPDPPTGGGVPPATETPPDVVVEVPPTEAPPATAPPKISEPVGRAQPVAGSGWYIWLALPIGLAAYSLFARAIGREVAGAGANRVAEVLRRRREAS